MSSLSPLAGRHKQNGATMMEFAGWELPSQYATGYISEHLHTRAKAGLFDSCHMGELLVKGKGATEYLSQATTINITALKPGRCRYGFLLNSNGGIMDDLMVYRQDADSFMLVVNPACKDSDITTLKKRLNQQCALEDNSSSIGKIDLQGPESFAVLEKQLPGPWRRLPFFGFCNDVFFEEKPILVSRTGYSGELGVEIFVPWNLVENLWELLLQDKRVMPVGMLARNSLRLEAGLPAVGQDMDEEHTPAEAGYLAVLNSQARYLGKDKAREVKHKLIPLAVDGEVNIQAKNPVTLNNQKTGFVTSCSFAPSIGKTIAFAYIKVTDACSSVFTILTENAEYCAQVETLPFYKNGSARNPLL